MTLQQFGQSIQEKYPQYAHMDPTQLGQQMIQKYPVYASQIDQPQPQAPSMQAPQTQPTPQVEPSVLQGNLHSDKLLSGNDLFANILNSVANPFVKTGKNIAGAGYEGARAIDSLLGNKNAYVNQQTGKVMEDPFLSQQDLQKIDTNPAEYIGDQAKNSAAIASYAIPFGKGANLLTKAILPGAAVGAGQSLPDAKNGEDVVRNAITGGLTGGALEALGGVLGKLKGAAGAGAQKGADAISGKVNPDIFSSVVKADPNYVNNIEDITNTAKRYGLMNGTSDQGLQKLPNVMNNLSNEIKGRLENVTTPVDMNSVKKNIMDKFEKNSSVFPTSQDFEDAKQYIKSRLGFGTGTDSQPSFPQTSYSKLYDLKSAVGDNLSSTFKKIANGGSLSPKEEANLALWGGLKDEIDNADDTIRPLNNDQHNLFDIAKGFVSDSKSAKKGATFAGNIFSTMAGNMLGGPLGGIAALGAEQAANSPTGRKILSSVLSSGSKAAQAQLPDIAGGIVKTGSALLTPRNIGTNNTNQNTGNNQQNIQSPNGNVTQASSNSNTPSLMDYIDYIQGRKTGTTMDRQSVAQLESTHPVIAKDIETAYQTQLGSSQQQSEAQARNTSDRVISKLENDYNSNNLAGGRVGGKFNELLANAGLNPNLNTYQKEREAAASQIAQALSDTGSKSTAKLQLAVSLLPTGQSTPQEAKQGFAAIRQLLGLIPKN